MKRIISFVIVLGFIMGCASAFTLSPEQRVAITAGKIGCPPEKITISDLQRQGGGMSTWKAKCEGRTYYCSRADNQNSCQLAGK
jgi:hypothetical protein